MRMTVLVLGSAVATALALSACGSSKPAKDPSQTEGQTEGETPKTDESPKWEGATPSSTAAGSAGPQATATSTGGSAPTVHEAGQRRGDQYDKEATEMVLKRAGRQVKDNCGMTRDDDGKLSGPWGKATIQVMLGRNGHSKGVTVPQPFDGKPTGKCIVQAFSNLTFPPWGGQDTPVDWEVEVVQPAAAGTQPKK